jgi:hypothetical protein
MFVSLSLTFVLIDSPFSSCIGTPRDGSDSSYFTKFLKNFQIIISTPYMMFVVYFKKLVKLYLY